MIIVVVIIPIIKEPIKKGINDWKGDNPEFDIIILSDDFIKLYDESRVPIKTAKGRNSGKYSINLIQESETVNKKEELEESLSTNVIKKITLLITAITTKTPLKNLLNKK